MGDIETSGAIQDAGESVTAQLGRIADALELIALRAETEPCDGKDFRIGTLVLRIVRRGLHPLESPEER